MKIVCINKNGYNGDITIGKTYEVIHINDYGDYIIINDKGDKNWYPKDRFKSLSEIRADKINKLLEDES